MAETTTLADLGKAMGLAQTATATASSAPTKPKLDAKGRSYATGRRKNAISRVWVKRGDSWLEAGRLATARWSIGVEFDDLPIVALVEQAVEATVQAGLPSRVRRFLARQLDSRPWPGQGGPPVGVREYAVDSLVDQRRESPGHLPQLLGLARRQAQRRQ